MYMGLVSVGPTGEESPPHTCLLQVTATDKDSGLNGQVSYEQIFMEINSCCCRVLLTLADAIDLR